MPQKKKKKKAALNHIKKMGNKFQNIKVIRHEVGWLPDMSG